MHFFNQNLKQKMPYYIVPKYLGLKSLIIISPILIINVATGYKLKYLKSMSLFLKLEYNLNREVFMYGTGFLAVGGLIWMSSELTYAEAWDIPDSDPHTCIRCDGWG